MNKQYAGVKDVNGKKIYEGDIVKTTEWSGWGAEYTEYNYYRQVQWNTDEKAFQLYDKDVDEFYKLDGHIEVIGNIFENPELWNEL